MKRTTLKKLAPWPIPIAAFILGGLPAALLTTVGVLTLQRLKT